MSQEIVNALRWVDGFHKNSMLLFDDTVASIRQNTLTGIIKPLVGPERWCDVKQNAIDSDHQGNFVFDHDGRLRFLFMLVKTSEGYIRDQSPGFKAICRELHVDVLFPLLLVTGVFEPQEVPRWRYNDDNYRRWLHSTLLLRAPENKHWPDPTNYALDKLLTIEVQGGDGIPWCEKARFTIRQMTDIRDSHDVDKIVAELLRL
jgi:hypothetical protein